MLLEVENNNIDNLNNYADSLETTWDSSAAIMKKLDKTKWNSVDKTIDVVLKNIRDKNYDMDKIKSSIEVSKKELY